MHTIMMYNTHIEQTWHVLIAITVLPHLGAACNCTYSVPAVSRSSIDRRQYIDMYQFGVQMVVRKLFSMLVTHFQRPLAVSANKAALPARHTLDPLASRLYCVCLHKAIYIS